MHSRSRYERNQVFTGDTDNEEKFVVFAPGDNNAAGDGKYYLRVSKAMGGKDLTHVHAEVIVAGATGVLTVQVHNLTTAADMLSTELTVDAGETGSDTAAIPHTVDAAEADVSEDDLLRIDVDTIHSTPAIGLVLTLQFK